MSIIDRSSVRIDSEEKKLARKTFVIDTNVLVYDASAIKTFKDNDVIIPLAVLEELDSLKRLSDAVGKNAREVIRYIDSLKTEKRLVSCLFLPPIPCGSIQWARQLASARSRSSYTRGPRRRSFSSCMRPLKKAIT